MKTLLTGALMLLFTIPSFAAANGTEVGGYRPFTVPANPTARQITMLFIDATEGINDLIKALRKVGTTQRVVSVSICTVIRANLWSF